MCNGEVEAQWVTGKWRGVGETLEPLGNKKIEQEAYGSKAVYTEGRLHLGQCSAKVCILRSVQRCTYTSCCGGTDLHILR